MDFSPRSIVQLARFSLQRPRAAARSLIAMHLPNNVRWMLFFLSVIVSALASYVGFRLLPSEAQAVWADAMSKPMQNVILQSAFWLLAVVWLHALGRWGAKKGSFADTLLLVSWWQIVFFGIQAAQILALLVFPPLGEIMGLAGLVLVLWLLTQFILELHRFQHFWRVLAGVIGALILAAAALGLILAVFVFAFTGGL